MSCLRVFHLNRGNDLAIVLNSAIYIRLLPNNSFRPQNTKKNNEPKIFIKQKIAS